MRRLLMLVLATLTGCGSVDAEKTITLETSDSATPPKEERGQKTPIEDENASDEAALVRSDKPKLDPDVACPPERPYVCAAPNEHGFECRERACPPACDRVPCPSAFVCVDCGDGPACLPRNHVCN